MNEWEKDLIERRDFYLKQMKDYDNILKNGKLTLAERELNRSLQTETERELKKVEENIGRMNMDKKRVNWFKRGK